MSDEAGLPTPFERPRRLRATPAMRRLVRETRPQPAQLMVPLFAREGLAASRPIPSLPGVSQHGLDGIRRATADAAAAGVGGVMIFGVPTTRDPNGSGASDPDGILAQAVAAAAAEAGDALVVAADVCLDEFTDHGHCGLLAADGTVDNDATLSAYAAAANAQADAGAALLGLSGMMDGQVAAVRAALDHANHIDTAILAYSAKYASAYYGPFRDAVESRLEGDRRTYQMDPANAREGLREATLDLAEGADMVMVKPALPYLDVLAEVAAEALVPVAAYHVSGEYAQIEAAAERGWLDRRAAHLEALTAMVRAGADVVLTYVALDLARWLADDR